MPQGFTRGLATLVSGARVLDDGRCPAALSCAMRDIGHWLAENWK